MDLNDDLRRIADVAVRYAGPGEELAGIVPAEPSSGLRAYVCAYGNGETTSWLVLDDDGRLLGTITDGDIRRAILAGVDLSLPVRALLDQRAGTPYETPFTAPAGSSASSC